jgi:O-antigen/teichoic acid export membrane protein
MHSALWAISQQLIRQGLAAGFMVVLANRISPAELGIIGIANIWNTFLVLFLELGFGAALVQRKEITSRHIASVFALNLACGAGLMLLSMALSGPVSIGMKAPAAQPVIMALSVSFLITAVASVQNSLAMRELRFKTLTLRDFSANSIAAAVGIIMAVQGYGVWAVVANSLLVNLLGALFIWRVTPHRIHLRDAEWKAIQDLWAFGSKVFGYSLLKHILRNTDSI